MYVDIVIGPQNCFILPDLAQRIEQGEKHLIELDFVEKEKSDKLPEATMQEGSS